MPERCHCRGRGVEDSGFSLVEVNLAIMIVAMGMLALFGLFPSALREGENAISDTHTALFADAVLSGAQGNSLGVTNWSTWVDSSSFPSDVLEGLEDDDGTAIQVSSSSVAGPIQFSGNKIRYMLEVDTGDSPTHMLRLWAWSGAYISTDVAAFKANAKFYSTEVCFRGAMP